MSPCCASTLYRPAVAVSSRPLPSCFSDIFRARSVTYSHQKSGEPRRHMVSAATPSALVCPAWGEMTLEILAKIPIVKTTAPMMRQCVFKNGHATRGQNPWFGFDAGAAMWGGSFRGACPTTLWCPPCRIRVAC